jgi:hypothetical protein
MTYQTKLGPKMILYGGDGARVCREARPTVAAFVDGGWELASEFTTDKPLCIGRVTENFFDPNRSEFNQQSPFSMARWYVSTYLAPTIRAQPQIDAWESNNEPVISDPVIMRWHAEFLAEFAGLLRLEFNRAAVIGNWSVGNPDYPLWAEYGPALDAARRYRAYLGRHNYAGPDRSTWGYLLLRHREDNARFTAMGYPDLPVILTECGADAVPFGSPPGRSWRDLYGDDAARYWNEILLPLEQELRADSYVVGGTVFACGYNWGQHNMDGTAIAQLWIDYARSAPPIGEIQPPPAPGPGPYPRVVTIKGLVGSNLRAEPFGAIVGAAWTGRKVLALREHNEHVELSVWVHRSRVDAEA